MPGHISERLNRVQRSFTMTDENEAPDARRVSALGDTGFAKAVNEVRSGTATIARDPGRAIACGEPQTSGSRCCDRKRQAGSLATAGDGSCFVRHVVPTLG